MGALFNYGSHREPLGMQRIDREVIPECCKAWGEGGRQVQIGEEKGEAEWKLVICL